MLTLDGAQRGSVQFFTFMSQYTVYMRIVNYPHTHYMRIKNYLHIHYMRIKPTINIVICGLFLAPQITLIMNLRYCIFSNDLFAVSYTFFLSECKNILLWTYPMQKMSSQGFTPIFASKPSWPLYGGDILHSRNKASKLVGEHRGIHCSRHCTACFRLMLRGINGSGRSQSLVN